jgi:adenylate cyclase
MALSASIKHKLKTISIVTIAGIIIGILFANLAFGFTYYRIIKGALIGGMITSLSSSVEMFFFQKRFKRLNFSVELLLRSFFYVLIISFSTLLVVVIHESMEDGIDIVSTLFGNDVSNFLTGDFIFVFIFAIAGSLSMNFIWQINKMLGRGVLFNVILGKYRRPTSEERIFMFLDIKSSTTLGEKLGANFFYDITDPIIETGGEVYQYVGDEIVLTWKPDKGLYHNNCVNCFFKIQNKIDEKRNFYLEKYGFVPEFKAGIHIGEAIVTEVGDLKKDIVYHGDVLNTASRIQSECNNLNQKLLISDEILKNLKLNSQFQVESMGFIKLRGKEKEIELYGVKETSG